VAFKGIRIMEIWEIVRRIQAGQTIRSIARSLGYDRKTIRQYARVRILYSWEVSFLDELIVDWPW